MAPALAFALLLPRGAFAHSVTVDGSAADWWGVLPPVANLGRIDRNPARQGEFVWWDATNDTRTPLASPGLDLTELRITGDGSKLYVMAALAGAPVMSGAGSPQLQIAIDLDRSPGSGALAFVDGARTSVASAAAWEYLLETRFGSGAGAKLYNRSLGAVATSLPEALGASGVIEVAVPWSALGLPGPPSLPIRFTIALFASAPNDSVLNADPSGGSNAVDALTDYRAPGAALNTSAEVGDGTVDDWRDLWFNGAGDVYAPIALDEIYYAGTLNEKWIQVVNDSPGTISLDSYKLGDQEVPGGNEGMGQFPSVSLGSGAPFVVARDGATFFAGYGVRANAETDGGDSATPDVAPFPAWAPSPDIKLQIGGDEVLLLDPSNTVIDVFTYHNGSWPGVVSMPVTANSHSARRRSSNFDTDDCSLDFVDNATPTPGSVSSSASVNTGWGSGPFELRGPYPNPFVSHASFALEWQGSGALPVSCDVVDLAGRRVRRIETGGALGAAGGTTWIQWDGFDDRGARVTPGLYFLSVRTPLGARTVRCAFVGP